jgi:hypothetical protein
VNSPLDTMLWFHDPVDLGAFPLALDLGVGSR